MEQPGIERGVGSVEKVEGRGGEGAQSQEPEQSKQLLTEALCA